MKQYMCVPGPMNINLAQKGTTQDAMNLFSSIINEHSKVGWNYHSMESITISQKKGCSGAPVSLYYYMLVFEKEV